MPLLSARSSKKKTDAGLSGQAQTIGEQETRLAPMSSLAPLGKGSNGKYQALPTSPEKGQNKKDTFSPYAPSLGLQETTKWVNENENFSGLWTDRTHGAKGRPQTRSDQTKKTKGGDGAANGAVDPKNASQYGKYGHYEPLLNPELSRPAEKPAAEVPDFTGTWICAASAGSWDVFLEMCQVEPAKIKLARGTKFGRQTKQTIKYDKHTNKMTIENNAMNYGGWSSGLTHTKQPPIDLTLDGTPQPTTANAALGVPGNGPLTVAWEGKSLVTRFSLGDKGLPALLRRTLWEKTIMSVKLQCADFCCTRIYLLVDGEGDAAINPTGTGNVWASVDEMAQSLVTMDKLNRGTGAKKRPEDAKGEGGGGGGGGGH